VVVVSITAVVVVSETVVVVASGTVVVDVGPTVVVVVSVSVVVVSETVVVVASATVVVDIGPTVVVVVSATVVTEESGPGAGVGVSDTGWVAVITTSTDGLTSCPSLTVSMTTYAPATSAMKLAVAESAFTSCARLSAGDIKDQAKASRSPSGSVDLVPSRRTSVPTATF
jgi:hypothetical protein